MEHTITCVNRSNVADNKIDASMFATGAKRIIPFYVVKADTRGSGFSGIQFDYSAQDGVITLQKDVPDDTEVKIFYEAVYEFSNIEELEIFASEYSRRYSQAVAVGE